MSKLTKKSCKGCRYWATDSDMFDWWPICSHPSFGDEGKALPNKSSETPEWCPLLNEKGGQETTFVAEYNFGDLLRDKITGFEGVVVGIAFYHTGCTYYGLIRREVKQDDNIPCWGWIDSSRLERVAERYVNIEFRQGTGRGENFPTPPSC